MDNDIMKIFSCNTYKECMDIMKQIRQKADKLIFDGTEDNIFSEDDLFRNYYKIKNAMNEIKNED
jgi:protein-disulfide isomerase